MGDDTKRNVLFMGAALMLLLTGVTGATLGGYVDWPQVWHTMATARSPVEDPDVLWARAQEYYEDVDKDPKMAIAAKACARRIVYLNPRHTPARKMLVALSLKEKDFVEAEAQSRQVLVVEPADLTARLGLGAALRGQKKNKEARDTFRLVWNDPKAGGLQKDEAGRNLQELDPDWKPAPPSYLMTTSLPTPEESPTPVPTPFMPYPQPSASPPSRLLPPPLPSGEPSPLPPSSLPPAPVVR